MGLREDIKRMEQEREALSIAIVRKTEQLNAAEPHVWIVIRENDEGKIHGTVRGLASDVSWTWGSMINFCFSRRFELLHVDVNGARQGVDLNAASAALKIGQSKIFGTRFHVGVFRTQDEAIRFRDKSGDL